MKVLWLCNIVLPIISKELGEKPTNYGGWLSGLLDDIVKQKNIDITICSPHERIDSYKDGYFDSIRYICYKETNQNKDFFIKILKEIEPDIIHIWGTEYKHSLDMVNAADSLNMIERVVVNIQGLVSVCGKYHYFAALPNYVYNSRNLSDWKHGGVNRISRDCNEFIDRGHYEKEVIERVNHVIGRTDWDEACTTQINNSIKYHHVNETLRSSFYSKKWEYSKCIKHSIFVSQANYPIKGFHIVLDAMPLILEQYPDAILFVTGDKPNKPNSFLSKQRSNHYSDYLLAQIDKYNLHDHVKFTGFLDEIEMCQQYLKSNVFVSASSIENESNSIDEAKILGMPVVASFVGGVPNRVTNYFDGYLYQYDAPYMLAYYVCKIFKEVDLAQEMGNNARKNALLILNKEKNVKDMIAVYQEIYKGK